MKGTFKAKKKVAQWYRCHHNSPLYGVWLVLATVLGP